MIYLVDYENVNLNGMMGIENLEETDHVIVFLGNNTGAIPFEWHIRIMDSKAQVKHIKCGKVSKNYLDFQLATFCGYIMAGLEHEKVYVVSKDKGFDSIVDFWTDNKEDVQIARIETIDESLDIPRPMNKPKERGAKSKKQNGRKNNKKGRGRQEEKVMEEPMEELMMEVEITEAVEIIEQEPITETEESVTEAEKTAEAEVGITEPGEETEQKEDITESGEETEQKEEIVESEETTEQKEEIIKMEEVAEAEAEITEPVQRVPRSRKQKEKEVHPEKINKLSDLTKKHIRQKIKDEQLNGGNYKTIYNIFMTQNAKNRFNTALVKAFQQEQGNRIYKKLLSEFESHLKNQE